MPIQRSTPAISYCFASMAADGPAVVNTVTASEMINALLIWVGILRRKPETM